MLIIYKSVLANSCYWPIKINMRMMSYKMWRIPESTLLLKKKNNPKTSFFSSCVSSEHAQNQIYFVPIQQELNIVLKSVANIVGLVKIKNNKMNLKKWYILYKSKASYEKYSTQLK